jgi:protein dithiol oxidoreductase (disulfide-forming)
MASKRRWSRPASNRLHIGQRVARFARCWHTTHPTEISMTASFGRVLRGGIKSRFNSFVALAALATCALSGASFAQGALREGTDYRAVRPAQPVEAPAGKVEVIEFFGYWCPHCNEFEPVLGEWSKRNEGKIAMTYVPIAFVPGQANLQRMYYALDTLGKEKELRRKIFNAIHTDRSLAPNADSGAIADWVEKNGVDKKKFLDTFNSFTVQAKTSRASQIARAYGVDAVPMMGFGGKYLLSIQPRTIGNADLMLAKVQSEK